jgi:hypothetical protein
MGSDTVADVTALGLSITLALCLLMVIVPRKYALAPVLILTCFMPMAQQLVLGGLHFPMLRILMIFGWLRLLVRQELRKIEFNSIDWAVLIWLVVSVTNYSILWGTTEALVNRLGHAYNVIGTYFMFRYLIIDLEDARKIFRITALLVIPLALAMLFEYKTQRNPFAVLGSVHDITQIREGVLRCQGPFAHPILAGSFGAALFPVFFTLWRVKYGSRALLVGGMLAAVVIPVTAGSSGPLLTLLAGIAALCLWPLRKHMRLLWWGFLGGLAFLQLVMNRPVWYVIAYLSLHPGSTSWYRAAIIDQAMQHIGQWWLIGTQSTLNWGSIYGDITNGYLREGFDGGILQMALFILIIARCFRGLSLARQGIEDPTENTQFFLWGLRSCLFAHVATFFGVRYFDQNFVIWFLLLAIISSTTGAYLKKQKTVQPELPGGRATRERSEDTEFANSALSLNGKRA